MALFCLGGAVYLVLYYLNWQIKVDGDEVEITTLFARKKKFMISNIEKVKVTRGGIKVYMKGKRFKAFRVESMAVGSNMFQKRMEQEGVPIELAKNLEDKV